MYSARPGLLVISARRPYAIAVHGISVTPSTIQNTQNIDARIAITPSFPIARVMEEKSTSAESVESTISMRSESCEPIQGIRITLNPSAPAIPPIVLAAYTSPTSFPESCPADDAAASARGKLAPHNSAGGRIANTQRIRSSWKVNHGLFESSGLMGQLGSESATA